MKYKIISLVLVSFLSLSFIGCEENYSSIPQKEQIEDHQNHKEDSSKEQDDDFDVIISPTGTITVI